MQVTFKTLSQESFKLDLQPTETIKDVKERIAQARPDAPVDLQKLLYNGAVLSDDSTVEQCNIDESRFVVLMVSKPKAAPAPVAPPAAAAPAEAPAAPAAAAAPAPQADTAALTPAQQTALDSVMGMGFTRTQALNALQVADFNADRAADLLLGGELFEGAGGAPAAGGAAAAGAASGRAPAAVGGLAPGIMEAASGHGRAAVAGREDDMSMEALRLMPQFEEIRRLVRDDPNVLPELLQQIAATNPDLMQLITANQQQFAEILNEIVAEDSDEEDDDEEGAYNDDHNMGLLEVVDGDEQDPAAEDPEAQLRQRGVTRIQVSAEESAAIDRLKAMGFPEALVIEAFFACDKNEDLAVNYILARMDEAADMLNE